MEPVFFQRPLGRLLENTHEARYLVVRVHYLRKHQAVDQIFAPKPAHSRWVKTTHVEPRLLSSALRQLEFVQKPPGSVHDDETRVTEPVALAHDASNVAHGSAHLTVHRLSQNRCIANLQAQENTENVACSMDSKTQFLVSNHYGTNLNPILIQLCSSCLK